jgi:hypothetical protein
MNRHFAAGPVEHHRREIELAIAGAEIEAAGMFRRFGRAGIFPTKNPAAPQPDFDLSNDVA